MMSQGVADANPDAYLESICNLNRVANDAALGNSPLWFGEWGLPTQFTATDDFLFKWADAQKLAYSKGKGWVVSAAMLSLRDIVQTFVTVLEFQGRDLTAGRRPRAAMVRGLLIFVCNILMFMCTFQVLSRGSQTRLPDQRSFEGERP